MSVQIQSPKSNSTVSAPFDVAIDYSTPTTLTLTCTVAGGTPPSQSKDVTGNGTWITGGFMVNPGTTSVTATLGSSGGSDTATNITVQDPP